MDYNSYQTPSMSTTQNEICLAPFSGWLNQTEISDDRLNLINLIPGDAFQIQNAKTNSCLTASTVNNKNNTYPDSDDNVNTPTLYHISMIECNSSHPQHFWQWTDNDTILNIGTYLCLTTIDGSEGPDSNQDSSEVEWLVLMPCVESDERQIWSCSGQYIQQPSSGKCLTTGEQSKEDDEENESSEERRRRRRNTDLKQIMEELGQFLNDVDDSNSDDLEQSTDTSSESHTTISDEVSHQALQEQTVWVEYCKLQNELQMWAGVTKHSDDTSTVSVNNENSICSQIGTTQHTLPRCYANDMTSISQVTSLTDYFAVEWITCNKHSYYVTGFYHTHVENSGTHVRDGLFTGMQCCATRSVFTGEPESPLPDDHADDCDEVEWWSFQDVLISEGWFLCPKGKFLKGFKIGPSLDHTGVHRIYKANCCRSHSASDVYEHCYTDTSRRLDNTGVHTCRMEGYLVTAMYLDRCVEGDGCTEKLTCCIEA